MNTSQLRIAIKPPIYLPHLSYVALMQAVDVFVMGDTFQYSRQSFQNRARIRTPQGWHWISIPLAGRQHGRPISNTKIDNRTHWRSKHLRSFVFNYSQSAYFPFVEDKVVNLYNTAWEFLGDITCQSVSLIHEIFQMKCRLVRASELEGCPRSPQEVLEVIAADEWVVDQKQQASAVSGKPAVRHYNFIEPTYRQHFEGFESNITALDLMCNYGPEANGVLLR